MYETLLLFASAKLAKEKVDAAGNEHSTLDGIFTQSPCSYKGTFTPVRGKASDFVLSGR